MQADINNAKSKGYNVMLRYLHFSILLFVADRILKTNQQVCSQAGRSYNSIMNILALILIGINLLGLCYVHCKDRFARTQFFILYGIDIIFTLAIMGLSFATITRAPKECMHVILLEKWSIFSSFVVLLLTTLVLMCNLFWVQRYTNCPGNIVWAYMFLTINWGSVGSAKMLLVAIGVAYLLISVVTLIVNTLSFCGGTTTLKRRLLKYWWVIAIVIMVTLQLVSLAGYLAGTFDGNFYRVGANRLLQLFLVGNVIDILFWLWGVLALQYENGDLIRDALIDRDQPVEIQDTFAPNPYIQGVPFARPQEQRRTKTNVAMMGTILR